MTRFGLRYSLACVTRFGFALPLVGALAEGEDVCLDAWIEELDFECAVCYVALLADELVEARVTNLAGSIGRTINSAVGGRGRAIDFYLEANGFAVFGWA
jgi:hypothetical protein